MKQDQVDMLRNQLEILEINMVNEIKLNRPNSNINQLEVSHKE